MSQGLETTRQEVERFLWFDAQLGRAPNTIRAYRADLQDYLAFCTSTRINPLTARRHDVIAFLADLRRRPGRHGADVIDLHSGAGLTTATLRRRLSAVRSFYDHLVVEQRCAQNPVPRGRYVRAYQHAPRGARPGLIGREDRIPWIPSLGQWREVLAQAKGDRLRDLTMLLLQYDGALRREELVQLRIADVEPLADATITVRGETSKSRRRRQVHYTAITARVLAAYLTERFQTADAPEDPLCVSVGPRHGGGQLSGSSYSKYIEGLARRTGLPQLTTHTMRHLRLTHLAMAGWDLHEIKAYAGHASVESAALYIHLARPFLREKYRQSMAAVTAWLGTALADLPGAATTLDARLRGDHA